jgi:hypothetical protein
MRFLWIAQDAYAVALLAAPGALLACAPMLRTIPAPLRLAASIVFSPMVLSLELAASALCGMTFGWFVQWIVPLNLAGLLPLLLVARRTAGGSVLIPVAVTSVVLLAPVYAVLYTTPGMRDYGWHNMMQLAAIQPIENLPTWPEDLDLAGFRLNYPWLGFAQMATVAMILDRPVTLLFPICNALQFGCMFLFLMSVTRVVSPGRSASLASAATAVALLAPGLFDIAVGFLLGAPAAGELRIEPMTEKYFALDTMVFGLSSFAAMVYAVLRGAESASTAVLWLIVLAAASCGVAYPLLFPSCVVLAGLFVLAGIAGAVWPSPSRPRYALQDLALFSAGFGVVTVLLAIYVVSLGVSAASPTASLVQRWQVRRHISEIWWVFGPMLLLLAPVAVRSVRERLQVNVLGVASAASLLCCFTIFSLPIAAEYKFMFGALLVLAPILAAELMRMVGRRPTRVGALAGAFVVLQAGAAWSLWHWQMPPAALLADAVPLDESTRWPHPDAGWNGGWMQAVRNATPADTVLLTADTDQPVGVFTGRSLFVAADWFGVGRPDGGMVGRAGYSMNRKMILEDVKRYQPAAIADRLATMRTCLAAQADPHALSASLSALAGLNRPVALHFAGEAALLNRLRSDNVGKQIFSDGTDTVWLLQHAELPPLASTLQAAL